MMNPFAEFNEGDSVVIQDVASLNDRARAFVGQTGCVSTVHEGYLRVEFGLFDIVYVTTDAVDTA